MPRVFRPRRSSQQSWGTQDGAGGVLEKGQLLGDLRLPGHQQPAHHVVVAAEIFGGAVHRDVGPQGQGTLEQRGHEGVVHDAQGPVGPGQSAKGPQVGHLEQGVGRAFHEQGLGSGGQGCRDGGCVGGVHVDGLDAEGPVHPLEEPVGAAVEVLGDHKAVARGEKPGQTVDGGHARGEGQPPAAAVDHGHGFLQHRPGRIARARIIVAGGLAKPGMPETGRLVDGHGHGPGPAVPAGTALGEDAFELHGGLLSGGGRAHMPAPRPRNSSAARRRRSSWR